MIETMPVTLEQLHKEIQGLTKEVKKLRKVVEEDYELADDLVEELEEARTTQRDERT